MRVGGRVSWVLAAAALALTAGCQALTGEDDPPRQQPTPDVPQETSTTTSAAPETTAPASYEPAPREFDHKAVQQAVTQILEQYHQVEDLESVKCPQHRPVKAQTEFTCTAVIGATEREVPITVTSDDGDYKVGYPR